MLSVLFIGSSSSIKSPSSGINLFSPSKRYGSSSNRQMPKSSTIITKWPFLSCFSLTTPLIPSAKRYPRFCASPNTTARWESLLKTWSSNISPNSRIVKHIFDLVNRSSSFSNSLLPTAKFICYLRTKQSMLINKRNLLIQVRYALSSRFTACRCLSQMGGQSHGQGVKQISPAWENRRERNQNILSQWYFVKLTGLLGALSLAVRVLDFIDAKLRKYGFKKAMEDLFPKFLGTLHSRKVSRRSCVLRFMEKILS